MYIVHLASELSPIAKVGGLGDVTAGLSKALQSKGENVEVLLPFYDHIHHQDLEHLNVEDQILSSLNGEPYQNTIWSAKIDTIPVLLVESHHKDINFKRGAIYGEKDDDLRFMSFTRTALEYLLKAKKHPDVLNLHDWLTALAAPLYHEIYKALGLKIGTIVTTLHNMFYQGICHQEKLSYIVRPSESLSMQKKLQDDQKPNHINLLKGALLYSDALTTVSPSYAEEIKGKRGHGLGPLLIKKGERFQGILNGIDTEYWNPTTDPLLSENYPKHLTSSDEMFVAKKMNRKALFKKLHMQEVSAPLFCSITRLVQQKGPEMIRFGIEYILKQGGQFILIGSTSEKEVQEDFQALAEKYMDNPHVHFRFAFDEPLAHLVYAAADYLLMPSLFEPCGLAQMIALRYGTVPIIHKVGGLKDTIFDIDQDCYPIDKRNGYTFEHSSNTDLSVTIDRVFKDFRDRPQKGTQMIKNGFNRDWSWKTPAIEYLKVYQNEKD